MKTVVDSLISKLYEKQPFLSELNNNSKILGLNNLLELFSTDLQNKSNESLKQFNILIVVYLYGANEKALENARADMIGFLDR